MIGQPWAPIATHGDSAEQVLEALTRTAAQTFDDVRVRLLDFGVPPSSIEPLIAPLWTAELARLAAMVPGILADMAATAAGAPRATAEMLELLALIRDGLSVH